ncbi:hypothetical protein AX16_003288 [Volvariella volvacea WC 439]|nr:hypothetical protein AX16_003288 [Volvariella volvacea WC 439]
MTSVLRVVDVGLALAALYLVRLVLNKQPAPFPPGPRLLPLIGNLLDIPKEQEWLTFAQWGRKWGGIISVSVFGQRIVILNSAKAALGMLEKRGAIYSDRPSIPMGDLTGWRNSLGLTPYSEKSINYRKFFHKAIGTPSAMNKFTHIEEVETHRLLQRICANADDLAAHIRKTAGAIILRISYGYQIQEKEDPFVTLADVAMEQFSAATAPGGFLVNLVPPLRHLPDWVPGTEFKRIARSWASTLSDMVEGPYDFVKQQMAQGIAEPSFTSKLLDELKDISEEQEFDIKWSAASLYAGGADTTVASVYAFFKAMALFPEVQKKAQAEIDAVIGNERLPSLEDRGQLPYLDALSLEVMRWFIVAPTGVPHRVMEDNVYDGYFIPKGSLVIANIWQMAHDPAVYRNPMSFNPDRFLGTDGREPEPDPRTLCFGFGRRICPGKLIDDHNRRASRRSYRFSYMFVGRVLADVSIFLSCAMTLAVFTVSKYIDDDGVTLEPDTEQTSGTVSHPTPFKCTIKPRSPAALALINSSIERT